MILRKKNKINKKNLTDMLDLYSDYLLISTKSTTATGLSELFNGEISHDKITRFLSNEEFDSKRLWLEVKKTVRKFENGAACLIIDDTIIEKAYMDENDIVCWHWDHSKGRAVKGINLLSVFLEAQYGDEIIRIPINYRIIAKTEKYTDPKTGKEKRKSPITKNEMMIEMLTEVIGNRVKFGYVLADSWFASTENMKFVESKGKTFIFEMKSNRLAALSEQEKSKKQFTSIDKLTLADETLVQVWLKDLPFPVILFKQVFENKDGSVGVRYLITNDLTRTKKEFITTFKKRWGVEEYHKSIKQNVSIGASPARTVRTQSNHIFASLFAYFKLELLSISKKLNHFAFKSKLYIAALRLSMSVLQSIKV